MKKIYRINSSNPDRYFLGVLGGIGNYFNIDGTIVRMIFLFLFFFTDFLAITVLYLFFYLLIPEEPNEEPKFDKGNNTRKTKGKRNMKVKDTIKTKDNGNEKVWNEDELEREVNTHKEILNNPEFKQKVDKIKSELESSSNEVIAQDESDKIVEVDEDPQVTVSVEKPIEYFTIEENTTEEKSLDIFDKKVEEEYGIQNSENTYIPKEVKEIEEEISYFKDVPEIKNPPKSYNDNSLDRELRISKVAKEIEETTHISKA